MLTSSPDGFPVLEKRGVVARRFILALGFVAIIGVVFALQANSGTSDRIIGAGSTFAFPMIQGASGAYQQAKAEGNDWSVGSTGVDYEPVGSLGGILRLSDPEVDFAVSDYPLSEQAAKDAGYVQFPVIVGSIVPVYNLGNATSAQLKLSAAILADIYLGKISNWSDPAIKAANPDAQLPDLAIKVIQRADGSGSTLHWTNYLSLGSADWKAAHGDNTNVQWPVGEGVRGSSKMAEAVKANIGAIGYLESGQAQRAALATASLQNAQGQFVTSTPASIEAAARGIDWTAAERASGSATADAYPIVTAAYVIMKRENRSAQDNARTLRFVQFMFDERAEDAKALGYLPLPASVVDSIKQLWSRDLAHQS
jgi:phosphate transport system substrate-binding protein